MFYVTHPSEEVAREIANTVVEEKLAACANVLPVGNIYWWEGDVKNGDEYVTIFKTTYKKAPYLEQKIEEIHPYEVPCIMRWEFQCNITYERWLRESVADK